MAMSAVTNRRRGAIYGKKATRSNGFDAVSFEEYLTRTPTKPKSTLSRIQSPAKGPDRAQRPDKQLFDVPLSDNEGNDARIDSILKPISKRAPRRASTHSPQTPKASGTASKIQVSTTLSQGQKRKRSNHNQSSVASGRTEYRDEDGWSPHQSAVASTSAKRSRVSPPPHPGGEDYHLADHMSSLTESASNTCQVAIERGEGATIADGSETDELQLPSPPITQTKVARHMAVPSTPTHRRRFGTSPSSHHAARTTPQQRQVWRDLLNDDDADISVQEIQQLEIASSSKPFANAPRPVANKRRLIDTLRPVNSPDPAQSSDSEDESELRHAEQLESGGISLKQRESSTIAIKPASATSSQMPLKAPKRTYGQQRSYLSEPSQSLNDVLAQPLDLGFSPVTAKPQSSAKPHLVRKGEFEMDDDDGDDGRMRSIHELRLGGDSRRFDDQMATIFDDLKDHTKGGLSRRRAALMSLAEHLCNPAFKARFVNSNFAFNAFRQVVNEQDVICGVACASAVSLIMKNSAELRNATQIHETGILMTLAKLLRYERDVRGIAKERKTNMSRIAQQSVDRFIRTVTAAALPNEHQSYSFSPRVVSLKAIEMVLRRAREAGSIDALLPADALSAIVAIATDTSNNAFEASATIEKQGEAISTLITALSALESLTITFQSSTDAVNTWSASSLSQIEAVSRKILASPKDDDIELRCLVLRLLLNMSNGNESSSDAFADANLFGSMISRVLKGFRQLSQLVGDDSQAAEFDELLLSLGTLFNLAEMSSNARRIISRAYASTLEDLVRVFNTQREKAREAESLAESQANVAFGYLAVLLGILCQNSTGLQRIRGKLPKQDLSVLVEAIEEFTIHHKMVDRQGSNEIWRVFTSRLQSVAEIVKRGAH